jgi:hypothetical protein
VEERGKRRKRRGRKRRNSDVPSLLVISNTSNPRRQTRQHSQSRRNKALRRVFLGGRGRGVFDVVLLREEGVEVLEGEEGTEGVELSKMRDGESTIVRREGTDEAAG